MSTLADAYCATKFILGERKKLKAFLTAHCVRLYEWNLDGGLAGGTAYEFKDGSACEMRRENDGKEVLLTRHPFASWAAYLTDPNTGPAQIARFGGQKVEVQGADVVRIVALLRGS